MTLEKVAKIIAEYKDIDVSTIKPESTFQELGIDSLDTVELIMSFEDTFGGTIEMSPDLKTVQDLVNLIDAQENPEKKARNNHDSYRNLRSSGH